MVTEKRFLYVYNYKNFKQVCKIKIKQITPLMTLEDSKHYTSCFMMEDNRVLKIRKLLRNFELESNCITEGVEQPPERKEEQPLLNFKDIKQLELRELKEKKAIYMGSQESKIFYRVQNMGIIYWDYETDTVERIKITHEGG